MTKLLFFLLPLYFFTPTSVFSSECNTPSKTKYYVGDYITDITHFNNSYLILTSSDKLLQIMDNGKLEKVNVVNLRNMIPDNSLHIRRITSYEKKVIIITQDGKIFESNDLIKWAQTFNDKSLNIYSINSNESGFYAVANSEPNNVFILYQPHKSINWQISSNIDFKPHNRFLPTFTKSSGITLLDNNTLYSFSSVAARHGSDALASDVLQALGRRQGNLQQLS